MLKARNNLGWGGAVAKPQCGRILPKEIEALKERHKLCRLLRGLSVWSVYPYLRGYALRLTPGYGVSCLQHYYRMLGLRPAWH
ncbi:MAG: hypothetical protein J5565_07390 [Muribaculaceae bacterium]|nr:hypothetical protein [Muribaculaceae bacterium]